MLRTVVSRGWYPTLITALAVVALIYEVSINIVVPVLVGLLCLGLIVTVINARRNELGMQALNLTQLATYFNRRFMGNSSVSVFAVIESLYSVENTTIWEWVRSCGMSKRIFDTWCENFATRVETDLRSRRFTVFLHTHLDELWAINNHYHEYSEQFCEIADKYEIPADIVDQYNRFAVEYNVFVQSFREAITGLRNVARTQIEAPSVKLAREIPEKR